MRPIEVQAVSSVPAIRYPVLRGLTRRRNVAAVRSGNSACGLESQLALIKPKDVERSIQQACDGVSIVGGLSRDEGMNGKREEGKNNE